LSNLLLQCLLQFKHGALHGFAALRHFFVMEDAMADLLKRLAAAHQTGGLDNARGALDFVGDVEKSPRVF
jgi:hypothetical protein